MHRVAGVPKAVKSSASTGLVVAAILSLGAPACDLFGPDSTSDLSIRWGASPAAEASVRVEATLSVGGWNRRVVGNAEFKIPAPGRLSGRMSVLAGEDLVAAFDLSEEVQVDHNYSIGVYIDAGDPRTFGWVVCEPRVESVPVLMRPPGVQADSVYLTWFGISKGAIC